MYSFRLLFLLTFLLFGLLGEYVKLPFQPIIGVNHTDIQLGGNAQIMVVIKKYAQIFLQVHKRNPLYNQFQYLQQLNPNSTSNFNRASYQTLKVSRDSNFVVFLSTQESKITLFPRQSNGRYALKAIVLTQPSPIQFDISEGLLCVSYKLKNGVKLYKITNQTINLLQSLTVPQGRFTGQLGYCVISRDQKTIVLGYNDTASSQLNIFTLRGNKFQYEYPLPTKSINQVSIKFSEDSKSLVVGSSSGIQLFTRRCLYDRFKSLSNFVYPCPSWFRVEISSIGDYIYAACSDYKQFKILQKSLNDSINVIQTVKILTNVTDISLTKSGQFLSIALWNDEPQLYKLDCLNDNSSKLCQSCQAPCRTCSFDKITCYTYDPTYVANNQESWCNVCSLGCRLNKFNFISMKDECIDCMPTNLTMQNYKILETYKKMRFIFNWILIENKYVKCMLIILWQLL